jgi:hypothetical protein
LGFPEVQREILGVMEQLLCAGSVRFKLSGPFALVLWRLFVGEFNRMKYSMLFNVYSSIKPSELVYYVLLGIFSYLC